MARDRGLPPNRLKHRSSAKRDPKIRVIIACEGKNTEPRYLEDFCKDYDLPLPAILRVGGAPSTVVDRAIARKNELDRNARRERDRFTRADQVWAMIDVDDHQLTEAKNRARGNDIKLAISHPCFEVWGLIHFVEHDAPDTGHQVQRKLRELMPGYDPNGSKEFDYGALADKLDIAIKRAKRMSERRSAEGTPGGNPSTTVYALVEVMLVNGKLGST